jgi:type IX secretion system PorP/SprF family membrane protein
MKKVIIFSATILLVFGKTIAQDDVQLSQFYNNTMFYNPADAGFTGDFAAALTYRAQWIGTKQLRNDLPQFILLNVGNFFFDQRSGVGLTVSNASHHVQNNLQIKASYNYHAQLGDEAFLAMGLNAGFISRRVDGVTPEGMLVNRKTYNMSDLGVGVKFYTPELQVGGAVQHIPGVVLGADKENHQHAHFYYYMIYNHEFNYDWKLIPHVFLRNAAGVSTNVDVGFRVSYMDAVQFGLAWRRDATAVLIGVDIGESFSIGYAFDYHMGSSALRNVQIGTSHEIVLRYRTNALFSGGGGYDW